MRPIVSLSAIVKVFGGTRAVDGVDFSVLPGEVHALLGGNGAGKSTLIKCLAGVHRPDSGLIEVQGQAVDPQVQRLPIAFIHQDLALVPWMSVAENIALAAGFSTRRGFVSWSGVRAQAERALGILGARIDPGARVADLSQADKSLVAIARALATDAELIVLDEPTASLPEAEVTRLFAALRRLRESGRGMVYVSHRLDEVFPHFRPGHGDAGRQDGGDGADGIGDAGAACGVDRGAGGASAAVAAGARDGGAALARGRTGGGGGAGRFRAGAGGDPRVRRAARGGARGVGAGDRGRAAVAGAVAAGRRRGRVAEPGGCGEPWRRVRLEPAPGGEPRAATGDPGESVRQSGDRGGAAYSRRSGARRRRGWL